MTRRARAITIDGIEYPSVAEAARALYLDPSTLYDRLSSRGHADTMPVGRPRANYPVTVDGITYASIHEASAQTGISCKTLRQRKQAAGTYDTPQRERFRPPSREP